MQNPFETALAQLKATKDSFVETALSLKSAVEKYNKTVNDPYNFLDVNNNIRMHEELIRQEDKRLLGKRRQTAIVLTIFGLLFVYFPQIVAFLLTGNVAWWFYVVAGLYFVGSIAAIVCFYLYIWPADIPEYMSPTYFFEKDLQQYKDEGYDDEEANKGVKYSYLRHLEKVLAILQAANRRKGFWHYWCMCCLSFTFIFYFATSAIVVVSKEINKNNTVITKSSSTMDEKKKFDPSKTHDVPPQVIKEGTEIKFANTTSLKENAGTKKR